MAIENPILNNRIDPRIKEAILRVIELKKYIKLPSNDTLSRLPEWSDVVIKDNFSLKAKNEGLGIFVKFYPNQSFAKLVQDSYEIRNTQGSFGSSRK